MWYQHHLHSTCSVLDSVLSSLHVLTRMWKIRPNDLPKSVFLSFTWGSICLYPTLVDAAEQFSKVVAPISTPISSAGELWPLSFCYHPSLPPYLE